MDTGAVPWSVIGPIATLVGALIGIGIGWGVMKTVTNSLKVELASLKDSAIYISTKVTTLEANDANDRRVVEGLDRRVSELAERVNEAEREIASLTPKKTTRRK